MFDFKKPTVQMLGRWQPWHAGHTALFEKAWDITNQVAIMVRDVQGVDAGMGNDDNPFDFKKIEDNISAELFMHGYMVDYDFIVMQVPNIVDISYGCLFNTIDNVDHFPPKLSLSKSLIARLQ